MFGSEGCIALCEGLTSPNPKGGAPFPGMAESWTLSEDGTIYTFTINKNAKWSNGDEVVADDFVWSWKRVLTPSLGSQYTDMLYYVKNAKQFYTGEITDFSEVGVKAIDKNTLEVVLENPTPADRVEDETTFRKKPFRTSYHGLWLKQLDSISKVHNISYFSFPELKYTTNNIGQKYDVWDWFEKEYGPQKVVEEMLDDTNHLNEYGNNLLLENYILQSNIKDCLTFLS